jgi:hypothetical protein
MSDLELIFQSTECDIFYNRDLNIVQTFWKGVYFSDERFRKILDEIINTIELKKCSIIIADARDMFAISQPNQEWILKSWYPRAVRAGFRYQGLILNKDTFSELTVKQISNEYDSSTIITHYFRTHSEALDWVRELQESNV